MSLKLYDLTGSQPERRFSPNCWRNRMRLAHKGLEADQDKAYSFFGIYTSFYSDYALAH